MLAELREVLAPAKLASGRSDEDLVFGSSPRMPFNPHSVARRADEAWSKAKLPRLELHEARHTFASILIAAGVGPKAVTTYMGHASIQTTFDLYGKFRGLGGAGRRAGERVPRHGRRGGGEVGDRWPVFGQSTRISMHPNES